MDLHSAQSPYTPAGGPLPSTNPPVLGSQVPGTNSGLPALGGLSVSSPSPMANQLQAAGRQGDSTLVHMSPDEVGGLQALAQAHGTSMTINPVTGLPEAFNLGKLLKSLAPTLLGAGLTFIPGVGPLMAAGLVGGGFGIASGSLKKGLLAGLQAYGGASLAGALAPGATGTAAANAAAAAKTGAQAVTNTAGAAGTGATTIAPAAATPAVTTAGTSTLPGFTSELAGAPGTAIGNLGANQGLQAIGQTMTAAAPSAAAPALTLGAPANPGFFSNFASAAREGLPAGTPKFLVSSAPKIAGMGLFQGISKGLDSQQGQYDPMTGRVDNSYDGPYYSQERRQIMDPEGPLSSKQRRHFENVMPEIYGKRGLANVGSDTKPGDPIWEAVFNPKAKKGQPEYIWKQVPFGMMPEQRTMSLEEAMAQQGIGHYRGGISGYARGGELPMDNGSFVVDARTVSELGNGSSNAGKELLARMGGRPVEGPGDGVSDSVPARIGGSQKARVARDEVIFPAAAVKRLGKGNPQRGTQKLYALMDKAHKARKKAKRGQDTGLRKGLA